MTREQPTRAHIREAEQCVKAAADAWDATNLSAIANCVSALERSAASLRAAFQVLRSSPETADGGLRTAIMGLQKDTARLQRLVDAAAAFVRGLPGPDCEEAELYQPGGSTRPTGSAFETWGMQG